MMNVKEGPTKDVCCVEIFKVSENDNKVAVCNEYSTSVMRGGVKTHSFNAANLITHLTSRHPGQYLEFVKIKQQKEKSGKKKKRKAISSCLSTLLMEA